MQPWQLVLVVCGAVLTVALVVMLAAVARVARRLDGVLTVVEQELRPLVGQVYGLTEDLRALTRELQKEVERVGVVTERAGDVAAGIARLAGGLGGLTRAGQIVGMVIAIRKGIDVFMHRLKQGDGHG
jgi:uncharacterized protein YoxC